MEGSCSVVASYQLQEMLPMVSIGTNKKQPMLCGSHQMTCIKLCLCAWSVLSLQGIVQSWYSFVFYFNRFLLNSPIFTFLPINIAIPNPYQTCLKLAFPEACISCIAIPLQSLLNKLIFFTILSLFYSTFLSGSTKPCTVNKLSNVYC